MSSKSSEVDLNLDTKAQKLFMAKVSSATSSDSSPSQSLASDDSNESSAKKLSIPSPVNLNKHFQNYMTKTKTAINNNRAGDASHTSTPLFHPKEESAKRKMERQQSAR